MISKGRIIARKSSPLQQRPRLTKSMNYTKTPQQSTALSKIFAEAPRRTRNGLDSTEFGDETSHDPSKRFASKPEPHPFPFQEETWQFPNTFRFLFADPDPRSRTLLDITGLCEFVSEKLGVRAA
ncbi:hypothetical protein BC936DRAFT_140333 [Jimgerdemannia flammicorona]|uniref:Uncharacterized protein n=1 Tax=Jimgerdemannia flammicorona TaxID=994334 RepID=A0A433DH32_9FUNG|nr:hypothetical protein BC936DRAFT_140333 [Jimgerdemannia flammicorona]